jgi:hypothetical protein
MGRKKIEVNWVKVESMAMAGANGKQIAAALGIHYDTLVTACKRDNNSLFSDYLQTKREKGNNLLLAKQYDLAMNGDRGMLIWLGKQRLNQSDKKEITQENIGQLVEVHFDTPEIKLPTSEAEAQESFFNKSDI